MSNTAQVDRDTLLRNTLPMAESVWTGSTLAYHALNAIAEHPDDPAFRDKLADSLVGQRASMWSSSEGERLGLVIRWASILDASVVIGYLGDETLYEFSPTVASERSETDIIVVHQILVPKPI